MSTASKRALARQDPLLPPDDLDAVEAATWRAAFAALPAGHLHFQDHPAMRHHVRIVREEMHAYQHMLTTGRKRDAAAHWRATAALVHASQRALRLAPKQRLDPRRAGLLAVGRTRVDGEEFRPRGDWRDLFPSACATKLASRTPTRRQAQTRSRKTDDRKPGQAPYRPDR